MAHALERPTPDGPEPRPDRPATPILHPSSAIRRNRVYFLLILMAALVLTLIMSITIGARTIPVAVFRESLPHLITAIRGGDPRIPDGAHAVELHIITDLRLPRAVLGVLVGAALGVAGALIQGHTRNPLADPGILGISNGAALAVVIGFSMAGVTSPGISAVLAFVGAILATIVVFGLATVSRGHVNPLTLILGGAAMSAILGAFTSMFILSSDQSLNRMRFWTVGSLAGRDLSIAYGILPFILIGLIAALASGPTLNLLTMGDDVASSLGVRTQRARVSGTALIALLAGAATAATGPIGFIGLLVPHIVRAATGPDYRWILPCSALTGAVLLLTADVVARIVARPAELHVGIVLAFVGAPFFMAMIYRDRIVRL